MNKLFFKIRIIIGMILFVISFFVKDDLAILFSILSYLCFAYYIFIEMLHHLKKGIIFDENVLMFIATIGALIIGEYHEAVMVILLYQIGEYLSDRAIDKSKASIMNLMDLRSDKARRLDGTEVSPDKIKIGEIILIKPGEKIPLDGIVTKGTSRVDTSSLTGEATPRKVGINDNIMSGVINLSGVLEIKVTKLFSESTVNKILKLMEHSIEMKTETEKFITKFAQVYTPIIVLAAILLTCIPVVFFNQELVVWGYRSLIFLVVSCPCALIISVPLGYFIGIGTCSKNGVLVKGTASFEKLVSFNYALFDKTGTLTKGSFQITKIIPLYCKEKDVLEYAAYAEVHSNHPIATAIKEKYGQSIPEGSITDYEEIAGKGIKAKRGEEQIIVGNGVLFDELKIKYPKVEFMGTIVLVAVNNEYIGTLVVSDEMKENSKIIANDLRNMGIKKVIMLSGDRSEIVKKVGQILQMDESYAELLPQDKVALVERFKETGTTLFMGDGINDAPVLALSDIGVSMGGLGSDAAIEASDIVIMNDDPYKIIHAIKVSKFTKYIVKENIFFALLMKFLVLGFSLFGAINMWVAIFADVGVTLLAVLNALRIIKHTN